jgi:hypothetical protein
MMSLAKWTASHALGRIEIEENILNVSDKDKEDAW